MLLSICAAAAAAAEEEIQASPADFEALEPVTLQPAISDTMLSENYEEEDMEKEQAYSPEANQERPLRDPNQEVIDDLF